MHIATSIRASFSYMLCHNRFSFFKIICLVYIPIGIRVSVKDNIYFIVAVSHFILCI